MPWLSLIAVALLCSAGAGMTYAPGVKDRPWYPWAMAGVSVCGGLVYGFAARHCRSDGEVFALSVAWDVVAAAVYVALPVALFGLRLPPAGWFGLGLAAVGVVILKASVSR